MKNFRLYKMSGHLYFPEDLREIDPALIELSQDPAAVPSINVVKTQMNPMQMGRIIKLGNNLKEALVKVERGKVIFRIISYS